MPPKRVHINRILPILAPLPPDKMLNVMVAINTTIMVAITDSCYPL